MRKIGVLILLVLLAKLSIAQVSIAAPSITYYSPEEYGGHGQNFDMVQTPDGRRYFANASGVLSYDGVNWSLSEIKGKAPVLSLNYLPDSTCENEKLRNTLFVGAKNEFGLMQNNSRGELVYKSLRVLADTTDHVGDIWHIIYDKSNVYFTSFKKIYRWDGQKLSVLKEDKFHLTHQVGGKIITTYDFKLQYVEGDSLREIVQVPVSMYGIHQLNERELLLISSSSGIYKVTLDEFGRSDTIIPSDDHFVNELLKKGRVYDYTPLKRGGFAVSTLTKGVFIFDKNGSIVDRIGVEKGLQEAMMLGVREDSEANLWTMQSNGISKIEYNMPFGELRIRKDVKDIVTYQGKIFLATEMGLYYMELGHHFINEESLVKIDEKLGRCWDLYLEGEDLFVCSSYGVYRVDSMLNTSLINNYAAPVFTFKKMNDDGKYFMGAKSGIIIHDENTGEIEQLKMPNQHSVRWIAYDKDNKGYWLSSLSSGISFYDEESRQLAYYDTLNGLNAMFETYVFEYQDEAFLSTDSGFYEITNNEPFEYVKSGVFNGVGVKSGEKIYRIFDDGKEVWLAVQIDGASSPNKRFIRENGALKEVGEELKALSSKSSYSFGSFENYQLFGVGKGLIVYDREGEAFIPHPISPMISKVSIATDSILYSGFTVIDSVFRDVVLEYKNNGLIFQFSSPISTVSSQVQYSYKLEGFDERWSEWGAEVSKEYTNLFEGEYTFKVKVKDVFGQESHVSEYSFVINPPFYREKYMYFVYFVILLGLVMGAIKMNTAKLKREKLELERIVAERTKEVVEQKEKVELQNKDILSSIYYAKRIQNTILPKKADLEEAFKDGFIFFKPRDVVSGDFYWSFTHEDEVFFAVVDCTGHGVPGAFVSMTANNHLNRIIKEKRVSDVGEILSELNKAIKKSFQEDGEESAQDGMDMSLVRFNKKSKSLDFAGAQNGIWHIRNGELTDHKVDKVSIGGFTEAEYHFKTKSIQIQEGDSLIMFTDGFADQFGGEKNKKFKSKKLKELLLSINDKSMNEQRKILSETFKSWQGDYEQVDDVLVVGVKF